MSQKDSNKKDSNKKDSNKKAGQSGANETDCSCDGEKNKIFTSIPLVEAWEFAKTSLAEIKEQKEYIDKLTETLGLEPESPIRGAFYALTDNLIESLELLVGDKSSAIEWFVYECNFGIREFEAGCKNNNRAIKTIEDLRWMTELDCSECKEE